MATDGYVKAVLTAIAGALLYLCAVLTPWPGVAAQGGRQPGQSSGPAEVVIVGWQPGLAPVPVAVTGTVPVQGTVGVSGVVETDTGGRPTRVVVTGWEDGAQRDARGMERPGQFRALDDRAGLPMRETSR